MMSAYQRYLTDYAQAHVGARPISAREFYLDSSSRSGVSRRREEVG